MCCLFSVSCCVVFLLFVVFLLHCVYFDARFFPLYAERTHDNTPEESHFRIVRCCFAVAVCCLLFAALSLTTDKLTVCARTCVLGRVAVLPLAGARVQPEGGHGRVRGLAEGGPCL